MLPAQRVLAAIMESREAYDTFERFGERGHFDPIGNSIYDAICKYYELDTNVSSVDRNVIEGRCIATITNPKHETAFTEYFATIPDGISVANFGHDLRELRRGYVGEKLALALANKGKPEEIDRLIKDYEAAGNESVVRVDHEILDIFDTTDLKMAETSPETFIKLWPKVLNDKLDGGCRRGHHVVIFARPETGKTLFTINMCAGFLQQGHRVLYIGNEEPATDLRSRIRARLLGTSKQAMRAAPKGTAKALEERISKGAIRVADLSPGTFREIDKLATDFNADVLVLDQLRNIRVTSDTRTNELERAATEARNLGKKRKLLVVSLTQAGMSATDKAYLDMSDIDSSKTGMPAQADLMIGLSSTPELWENGIINVSLPKNKLSGNHAHFSVTVCKLTGKVS